METKQKRGFACMKPELRKAIASKGGSIKGRKGFAVINPERRSEIARMGGKASRGVRKLNVG